jgi:phage terminase large subunit-like protein
MDVAESLSLVNQAFEYKDTNKLRYFDPYPYQKRFADASSYSHQLLLMAANRIGKSEIGAEIMASHLTGIYPDWYEGRKFDRPIKAWAAGINNDKTRDILQAKLCGEPGNPEQWGKGFIPKECLGETIRKPGVPNALQGVYVKHKTGKWSYLGFKSYEMEAIGFMGESVDVVWLDEEPKQEIYTQALTRTLDRRGLLYMTFTPENGVTEVVNQFMNDLKDGQFMMMASWDDASSSIKTVGGNPGHLDEKTMEQILAAFPPHEREMRSKGVPSLGSGLIYPIPDEDIVCEPFEIPPHYLRGCGLDFGWDHATAAVFSAYNEDTDTLFLYDSYKQRKMTPDIHALSLKGKGCGWIPVFWPHDGNRSDGYGGQTLAELYRKVGVNMHYEHFSNPPGIGEGEGDGGNQVSPGVMEILQRLQTGRLKVFKNLYDWFEEKRMYHRKDGKIVTKNDDLMAATRYAVMSLRHFVSQKYMVQSKSRLQYKQKWIV